VRQWDVKTGKQRRVIGDVASWVRGAAVSPDGKWLATSNMGNDHAVRLWDLAGGKQVERWPGHGPVGGQRALRFTRDGKELLSWGDDMMLRRFDVGKGKTISEFAVRPDNAATPAEAPREQPYEGIGLFASDSVMVYFDGRGGLFVFDTDRAEQKGKVKISEVGVWYPAATPDGKHLLVSGYTPLKTNSNPAEGTRPTLGVVSLYDLTKRNRVWSREVGKERPFVSQLAVCPDNSMYAVAIETSEWRIEVGDLKTGKLLGTIKDVPARVHGMAFSPDSKRLLAGLGDTTALVWDVAAAVGK
jgi:cytochrome c